jgi:1-acyl-sn-glycerol-3-phosphate acyltransferase
VRSLRTSVHRADPGFPFGAYNVWRSALPLGRLLGKWWVDFERSGPPLPAGPVVVAANHYSHVDPVIVGLTVERPIRYLAVDELYGNSRFFDRLTFWLGAIPMSRTRVPLGALRTALAELAAGGSVGLFPEGVRVWTWGERAPKRGAAWLARRAGVPLVPVAVAGTDQVMGRGARRISRRPAAGIVCDPIHPGDFDGEADPVASMTATWATRIGEALDTAYRSMGT